MKALESIATYYMTWFEHFKEIQLFHIISLWKFSTSCHKVRTAQIKVAIIKLIQKSTFEHVTSLHLNRVGACSNTSHNLNQSSFGRTIPILLNRNYSDWYSRHFDSTRFQFIFEIDLSYQAKLHIEPWVQRLGCLGVQYAWQWVNEDMPFTGWSFEAPCTMNE